MIYRFSFLVFFISLPERVRLVTGTVLGMGSGSVEYTVLCEGGGFEAALLRATRAWAAAFTSSSSDFW